MHLTKEGQEHVVNLKAKLEEDGWNVKINPWFRFGVRLDLVAEKEGNLVGMYIENYPHPTKLAFLDKSPAQHKYVAFYWDNGELLKINGVDDNYWKKIQNEANGYGIEIVPYDSIVDELKKLNARKMRTLITKLKYHILFGNELEF